MGLAYHEACRSQKYGLRFQQQQQQQQQQQGKPPTLNNPLAQAIANLAAQDAACKESGEAASARHKRTRRRRRRRAKDHGAEDQEEGEQATEEVATGSIVPPGSAQLQQQPPQQGPRSMIARWGVPGRQSQAQLSSTSSLASASENSSSRNSNKKKSASSVFAQHQLPPPVASASLVTHPQQRASSTTALSGGNNKPPHDAPMKRKDMYFSLRCGMVRVTGDQQAVGRVTLVNWDNQVVLDALVKVPVPVLDYQSNSTGITPERIQQAVQTRTLVTFEQARDTVSAMIKGKILLGHGLEVDLNCLGLSHPWCDVRDTANYAPYMQKVVDPLSVMLLPRDLSTLVPLILRDTFYNCPQRPPQGPVEEAQAILALYKHARQDWEAELVRILQQKERQRELVVNMRQQQQQQQQARGGGGGRPLPPPVPLKRAVPTSLHSKFPAQQQQQQYPSYPTLPISRISVPQQSPSGLIHNDISAYDYYYPNTGEKSEQDYFNTCEDGTAATVASSLSDPSNFVPSAPPGFSLCNASLSSSDQYQYHLDLISESSEVRKQQHQQSLIVARASLEDAAVYADNPQAAWSNSATTATTATAATSTSSLTVEEDEKPPADLWWSSQPLPSSSESASLSSPLRRAAEAAASADSKLGATSNVSSLAEEEMLLPSYLVADLNDYASATAVASSSSDAVSTAVAALNRMEL